MGGAGVRGVVFAGSPDFVEKESARLVNATMEIESQAAFFLSRWRDQRAKFGFEEHVLAFLGTKRDDECDCMLWKLRSLGAAGAPTRQSLWSFAEFPFGHVGGDCTPNAANRKYKRNYEG